jgi:hypothetical protein
VADYEIRDYLTGEVLTGAGYEAEAKRLAISAANSKTPAATVYRTHDNCALWHAREIDNVTVHVSMADSYC